ncbi:MAG: maleylpyruvate isomerase family mycothiol-dependent enzyme [Mycobacterium sp.]
MGGIGSHVWPVVHAERRALVEDLTGLDAAAWETPSLCAGWAVRDVIAHLAATAALSRIGFAREFVRAGFSVERIVERQVARARGHDASATLAALRSAVDYVVSPPLPVITRVIEIVVHGEDVRRPLGMNHTYSTPGIADAIGYLVGDRPSGGKRRLKSLTLSATDADFSVGSGPLVRGPAVALLLAASGRSAAIDEMSGPGASQLINRVLHA